LVWFSLTDLSRLHGFLRRARRRTLAALVLQQAVVAVAIASAGVILLLFFGTQVLEWHWILIVCAGSFLFGLSRTLRRAPSTYRLAQQTDRRLALEDCLSTAYYFSDEESKGRGSKRFQELVFERATKLCGRMTAKAAAPIRVPRSAYAATALALAALGMFSIRYFVRGSLDLRPPLMPSVTHFFRPAWLIAVSRKPAPQAGLPRDPQGARSGKPGARQDGAAAREDSIGTGQKGATGQGDNEQSGQASSLLEKLRDAIQGVMDKLKTREAAGKQMQQGKEKGKASPDGTPGQRTPQPDRQGDQTTPGDANAQAGQKFATDRNGEDGPADSEGGGIGDSNGAKDLREAEQLAAMGKISEIFGKRQASLTGEVMVRAPSREEQKLNTPYTESAATHAEGGGEIQRDQVPLIYQRYVQQYFEQVHRPAAATGPAGP
jgi:hypothetical protein